MDRKLYRYEYWTLNGGLFTDYAWITSVEKAVDEIFGLDSEERIYKLIPATQLELDAYQAGYGEGYDVGQLTERIAHDNGTRYEADLPIVDDADLTFTEKFICGICNAHREVEDKSGQVVYVGLYGTEWQICVYCSKEGGLGND